MSLRDALRAELCRWPLSEARIFKMDRRRPMPHAMLGSIAKQVAAGAIDFPIKLSRMLTVTHDPAVRAFLIGNMLEEEGLQQSGDGRVVRRPEHSHVDYALCLTSALGLDPDEVRGTPAPRYPFFDAAIERGRPIAALAFLNVGMESLTKRTCTPFIELFARHGLTAKDLVFFDVHGEADTRHSETALDFAVELARDETDAREVVEGARQASAWVWNELNGGSSPSST